eukprot:7384713-Prymnesium_polylepis.1
MARASARAEGRTAAELARAEAALDERTAAARASAEMAEQVPCSGRWWRAWRALSARLRQRCVGARRQVDSENGGRGNGGRCDASGTGGIA